MSQSLDKFRKLFECKGCRAAYAVPPIIQCISGHIVCESCREGIRNCPVCDRHLGNLHNRAMEQLAAFVKLPCAYYTVGCPQAFIYDEKLKHEKVCEYRIYQCPCIEFNCDWKGNLKAIFPHLRSHENLIWKPGHQNVFNISDLNVPNPYVRTMLQICVKRNFLFVFEKRISPTGYVQFFASVVMIATQAEANKFFYVIQIKRNDYSLSYETTMRSIEGGLTVDPKNADALIFTERNAEFFANNADNLDVHVMISMDADETPNYGRSF